MRVFAISDIHIDYEENDKWLRNISAYDYTDDILIIPGDISDDIGLLEKAFRILGARFHKVAFVPGNHDLWIRKDEKINSFEKCSLIHRLAEGYGIIMQPTDIKELTVIPIFSWYDYTFGSPSDHIATIWMDYYVCKWPEYMNQLEVAQQFFNMNIKEVNINNKHIITFSHFVPRIDLIPLNIPDFSKTLTPVLGSVRIEDRIRLLKSHVHVYGHSHINTRINKENVLYINNAFGYPKEYYTNKQIQLVLEL